MCVAARHVARAILVCPNLAGRRRHLELSRPCRRSRSRQGDCASPTLRPQETWPESSGRRRFHTARRTARDRQRPGLEAQPEPRRVSHPLRGPGEGRQQTQRQNNKDRSRDKPYHRVSLLWRRVHVLRREGGPCQATAHGRASGQSTAAPCIGRATYHSSGPIRPCDDRWF